jgi:tripartite-type tricarboxylate transporter receptor subunit TctC
VQFVFERSPDLPDTPTSVELGRTAAERDALSFYTSGEELGRSIIAPPGVGSQRLGMFRNAFQQMLKDPDFQAEVKKARLEYNPLSGEKLQAIVEATIKSSPETIARTRALLGR